MLSNTAFIFSEVRRAATGSLLTFQFSCVYTGLLLVSQQRVEESVHEIGVRDFVGHLEERREEALDVRPPLLRDLLDVRPADVHLRWEAAKQKQQYKTSGKNKAGSLQ